MDATKLGYNHSEAFCVMRYECEKCRFSEVLWNSRDGVTPFMIQCPECGGMMKHADWDLDECKPDYLPKPNQRIFVDLTQQIYEVLLRARVRYQWIIGPYPLKDRFKTQMEAVKALMNFREGEPYVIRMSKF
jgi:hypothetical protein